MSGLPLSHILDQDLIPLFKSDERISCKLLKRKGRLKTYNWLKPPIFPDFIVETVTFYKYTVCPKLFGPPKMYLKGPQMSNYCAQMPSHTRLYIHGGPQIQKSPFGYTQGPKFIVFTGLHS